MLCMSVTFSRVTLIGQRDHVSYRDMMRSETTADALWSQQIRKLETFSYMCWVSNYTEMNGPSSLTLGAWPIINTFILHCIIQNTFNKQERKKK